jgi:hypothetical protein
MTIKTMSRRRFTAQQKAAAVLQVFGYQAETALLRQTGIGMAMHGCVRSGLVGRTSTRSGLTPPCQLNNVLRQNNYALAKALNKLDRYALLVIDDIGYVRKDEAETSVLFELVMHRYERRSLLVTSNQPLSEWETLFSTSAMPVAAVDRLVDHSTIIQTNGESNRRKRAQRMGSPTAREN